MPIELSWYIEDRVLIARDYGVITVEELREVNNKVTVALDVASQPIHVLIDTTLVEETPNLMATRDVLPNTRHPNSGWYVICGQSIVIRMLSSIVAQAAGVKVRFYPSLEEGVKFLKEHDETVEWDKR